MCKIPHDPLMQSSFLPWLIDLAFSTRIGVTQCITVQNQNKTFYDVEAWIPSFVVLEVVF